MVLTNRSVDTMLLPWPITDLTTVSSASLGRCERPAPAVSKGQSLPDTRQCQSFTSWGDKGRSQTSNPQKAHLMQSPSLLRKKPYLDSCLAALLSLHVWKVRSRACSDLISAGRRQGDVSEEEPEKKEEGLVKVVVVVVVAMGFGDWPEERVAGSGVTLSKL